MKVIRRHWNNLNAPRGLFFKTIKAQTNSELFFSRGGVPTGKPDSIIIVRIICVLQNPIRNSRNEDAS
jgi:hypothetical protein